MIKTQYEPWVYGKRFGHLIFELCICFGFRGVEVSCGDTPMWKVLAGPFRSLRDALRNSYFGFHPGPGQRAAATFISLQAAETP